MKRKIVKQGAATLTLSLPAKWCKNFKLKGGDEIDVDEQDNNLILSTTGIKGQTKCRINSSSFGRIVRRIITQLYQSGFDEIEISFDNPNELNNIQEIKNKYMIGFEIVSQRKNGCTLKDIVGLEESEFENIFRRIFLLIKGIGEDGYESLKSNDKKALENLIVRDNEINKFTNYCIRYINKKGYSKNNTHLIICNQLEKIGDEYAWTFKTILENNIKLDKILLDLFNKINNLFAKCYEFTYNKTYNNAWNIAQLYTKLKNEILKSKTKQKELLPYFHSLIESIILIQGMQLSQIKEIETTN